MEAVERALAIRKTTSLDQLCLDGEGSTLHDLIADEQNSNTLDQLDWDLAAEAIEARPCPQTISAPNGSNKSTCRARPSKHWPPTLMFAGKACANK